MVAEQKPADARDRQQQNADGDGKQVAIDQGRLRIRVAVAALFLCFGIATSLVQVRLPSGVRSARCSFAG
jgi:hypothetical protein